MTSQLEVESEFLDQVIKASKGDHRTNAVNWLKSLHMRQIEAHDCLEIVERGDHPALRATAAQVLGFHRAPQSYSELIPRLLACANAELDLVVRKSIAFSLRGTAELIDLLSHPDQEVVVEATVGMPDSHKALREMLLRFFSGVDVETEKVMTRRFQNVERHADVLISFLMNEEFPQSWGDPTPRVLRLFGDLCQSELLLAICGAEESIRRTLQGIWPGIRRRERKRVLMDIFIERVEKDRPAEFLLLTLVRKIAVDSNFYATNRRFLEQILQTMEGKEVAAFLQLAADYEGELQAEGASRLAEVLAFSSRSFEELRIPLENLMAMWEVLQPGLGLKVFHTRLGAGRVPSSQRI